MQVYGGGPVISNDENIDVTGSGIFQTSAQSAPSAPDHHIGHYCPQGCQCY